MMSGSWLLWMVFMFLFLVPPIGYVGATANGARPTRGTSSGAAA